MLRGPDSACSEDPRAAAQKAKHGGDRVRETHAVDTTANITQNSSQIDEEVDDTPGEKSNENVSVWDERGKASRQQGTMPNEDGDALAAMATMQEQMRAMQAELAELKGFRDGVLHNRLARGHGNARLLVGTLVWAVCVAAILVAISRKLGFLI